MKKINKIHPPQSFREYCAKPYAEYDGKGFPKDDLKSSLLLEQGYICCYCMKRIPEKVVQDKIVYYKMKVEHFQSQSSFSELQLDYQNLFASCTGNEGQIKSNQTCDTFKGDKQLELSLISSYPNCESFIKYNAIGEISSSSVKINAQLTEVLNLNTQKLREARKQVYLTVQNIIEAKSRNIPNKQIKLSFFEKEKAKWLDRDDSYKLKAFCMVAVYYLDKKIKQYS